ncbi:MAG: aminopeptidase P family protein [Candidatus Abyssobacteria bacterium SURF_17]|jgi:Xaa-Pro aminopeptidase|uniref:Aminopeptidase P family protein n=1 Tax=Candidatus Abyssobacteria bacterium SURF_17 TaxID=2093361 RepID=A0A419EN04_9BACT|nr:MAG: aminopeptidase P family protein [Candidatus Abyssubacteria bacterium SURF_17]
MSEERIAVLRAAMAAQSIDAAVLLYSRDILYYTGASIPSILLVTPQTARLYARRAFGFAQEDSTIPDVVGSGNLRDVFDQLGSEKLEHARVGLELDVIPAELFLKIREALPRAMFVNVSPLILSQRMIKDERELVVVRASATMTDKAHRRAREVIRAGMREVEMAAEVEAELRRNKHEGILVNRRFDAYTMYGMIGSGEALTRFAGFANVATGVGLSPAMRISTSDRVMSRGDLVMIDITGCHHGYITDVTRPYVIGRASQRQVEVFEALCTIEDEIFRTIKPGVPVADVYARGVDSAARTKFGDYFMGYEEKGRFVGHGLGLELDEPPVIGPDDPTIIRENMTLAVEINTIIPDFGAIKVEDSFIVKSDGVEVLSNIERRLFEVDV